MTSPRTDVSNPHTDMLNQRHAELEARLAAEERRPMPDTALVAKLKKEKLRIRDVCAAH